MAKSMERHGDYSAEKGAGRSRRGLYVGAAVAAVVIGGGMAFVGLSDDPVEGQLGESPLEDARPVGAGTFPDGDADEFREGLENETTRGDFIEPGAPTDGFTTPLLDTPEQAAPSVPSIDQLDPGPGVNDDVLDRMAPDGDEGDNDNPDDSRATPDTENL